MFPENSYTVTFDLKDVKYDCVVCTVSLKRLIALCRHSARTLPFSFGIAQIHIRYSKHCH